MKLYTLTYDCNRPTSQQINVETNTDYKVGVKVTRDGKTLPLNLSDVQIDGVSCTGESNGYVTFEESTGDTSYTAQHQVSVVYNPQPVQDIEIKKSQNTLAAIHISDHPELLGMELRPDDIEFAEVLSADAETPPTSADVEAAYTSYWDFVMDGVAAAVQTPTTLVYDDGTNRAVVYRTSKYIDDTARAQDPQERGIIDLPPVGVPYFLVASGDKYRAITSFKLDGNYAIWSRSIYQSRPFKYRAAAIRVQTGQPLDTTFRLIESVRKSQVGDVSDFVTEEELSRDTTLSATTAYTNWVVSPAKWTTSDGTTYILSAPQYGNFDYYGETRHGWYWTNPQATEINYDLDSDDPAETSLSVAWDESSGARVNVSFSREAVVGYQLGDQSDKILADGNTVKNLVAGVVEDFGPWRVFSNDGTVVNNAYVIWQPSGNCWVMYDGSGSVIGEADNGEINNNLIFCEGTPDRYAYRRHTFTCPNGVEIQAAPSINGFYANIDNTTIKNMVLLGLLNHYGANLYVYSD